MTEPVGTSPELTGGGTSHRLASNQPIILDQADDLWIVESGVCAVFAVKLEAGIPTGARHFLLEVRENHPLFGVETPDDGVHLGFIVVALREARLRRYSLGERLGGVGAERDDTINEVLQWAEAVAKVHGSIDRPRRGVRLSPGQSGNVHAGLTLLGRGQAPVWMRVEGAPISVHNHPDFVIQPGEPCLLADQLWYHVLDTGVAKGAALEEFDDPSAVVVETLAAYQRAFLDSIQASLSRQRDNDQALVMQRMRRQEEITSEGMEQLASVLSKRRPVKMTGSPLVAAARAVASAQGIKISPASKSEDLARVSDPLDAIARASHVRVRKVLLRGPWWKRDSGPILAHLVSGDERTPVALLLRRQTYYVLNPKDGTEEPLTPEIRQQIDPQASTFYTPLPDKSQTVWALLRFGTQGRLWDIAFIFGIGLLSTLLGFVAPQATGLLMDFAIPAASRGMVLELVLALAAATFGTTLFRLTQAMLTMRFGIAVDARLQAALWDRLLRFRPSFFRRYSSGDLQTRVMAVSEVGQELNGATLSTIVTGSLAMLNLALMWYYSSNLVVVAVIVGLIVFSASLLGALLVRGRAKILQDLAGEFFGNVVQLVGGVAKLRVAGAEHRAFNFWVAKYTEQLRLVLSIQAITDWVITLNRTLYPMTTVVLFWVGLEMMRDVGADGSPGLTLGIFLAFNAAFGQFIGGVTNVSNTILGMVDTLTKTKRIKPLLVEPPEISSDAADPGRLTGRLEIVNVSFQYREDGPTVLNRVSLRADPGEFIALVGPSGCGKSTILRLLLGFESPVEGAVIYDGQDMAGLDVLALRRQLGVVLQNGRVAAGSIMENIAGNSKISFDEAWESAADAGFAEDVRAMPMEMHTIVSEGGANMSGGQRQRLLIARALALRPKLILFDEATSALDNRTQKVVSDAMDRRRVTRVVVAHRLSTIRAADRIYVLDAGNVVQVGDYDTLAAEPGIFRNMVERQTA